MKHEFLVSPSKRVLYSALMASALLCGGNMPSYAEAPYAQVVMQAVSVKGQVVDSNGEPIIGASVLEKGTNNGVITDIDGNFTLKVRNRSSVIVVSYLGYKTAELSASDKKVSQITLKEDTEVLDEVVVVGYGVQKKTTLTGAIDQVGGEVLESRAVTNVGLALQGQTPGLTVTRSSSRPGNEGLNFQIRGATSVNGGSPLIVIDGVPAVNATSFQNMNSDDIETISVLKDGAASIYGAKAANGVILVTTKKGKGKVNVNYDFNMRFTTTGITSFSPSMQQYATMFLEANKEEEVPDWWGWLSKENLLKMQSGYEGIYVINHKDWGDKIFLANSNRLEEMFATRFSYQHNLSVSGSTEKSDYRISAMYADNQGNLATAYDGQKQINLRMNYGIKLTDWFKLETSTSLIKTDTSSPSCGLDASLYGNEPPLFPAKNPYGQWYANFGSVGDRQPAAATSDGGRDNRTNLTTRVDLKAIVDIWKGISFEGMASFQNEEYRRDRWVTPVQTYDWFGNPAKKVISNTIPSLIYPENPLNIKAENNPGYLMEANNMFYQYYSGIIRYKNTFVKVHNVSAMVGINAEKWANKKLAAARKDFEDTGVYDLNLATGAQGNSGGKSQNGTYSYIARVNYDYNEKYLLELMGRRDGNSKFALGHKFQNFGSVSVGWAFTKEKFMEWISPVMSFGKVRINYSSSGNDAGLSDFDYLALVGLGNTTLGYPAGTQVSSGFSGLISYDRTWERVIQKNFGVDLNFFDNRLSTTFEYFIKDNKGMLSQVTYPSILGGTPPKTNSGHLNVKGWELTVGWRDNFKDFSYFVNFNVSDTKSMLKDLEGADAYYAGRNGAVNGYPLNSYFLYRTDGFFESQAEVDRYYQLYGDAGAALGLVSQGSTNALRPGDTKRVDLNGDYKITADGSLDSDLQFLSDSNPHYVFGINAGFNWKGLDFSAMFQGVGKQYIMRTGWMAYPFNQMFTNQNPTFLGKTWTEDNPNAKYPRLTTKINRADWNYENNDFMLQNNRYIRLKALIIGYTLPQTWTRKARLEKVRVYFSGNDLWEATSIADGFDPEMGETSNNNGYPFCRTWSFGVNIGF